MSRFRRSGLGLLLHLALVLGAAGTAFADGESPASASKSLAMDYGPFLAHTVAMPGAKNFTDLDGVVIKGITIQLKAEGKVVGAALFDTMLCRWAGAWVAEEGKPPLKLIGTPFDGSHGTFPKAQGIPTFSTRPVPGWAKDGKLDDPRENPYVPLPRAWAHYSGLYVSGDRVVLRYTVQGVEVVESPGFVLQDGVRWITRTLRVAPHAQPLTLALMPVEKMESPSAPKQPGYWSALTVVAPAGTGTTVRVRGGVESFRYESLNGHLCLTLPPTKSAVSLALEFTSDFERVAGPKRSTLTEEEARRWTASVSNTVEDLVPLTRGGPARYAQPIVTAGKLGATGAAYEVDTLTLPDENPWKAWMRPTGFDFFADGKRAALCTWSGDVWTVSGVDESLGRLEWRRIATGLFQPLGLKIVGEQIYVLGRDQITRLHDLNGDGEADFYENFNNDVCCTPNYHEFAADLQTDDAGNFYFCKNAPLKGAYEWDKAGPHSGCMLRVSKDGSRLDIVATGLRATNGCGIGPHGELTTGDNEGIWTPVSRLNWIGTASAPTTAVPPFLGALGMDHRAEPPKTFDPPLCWLPWGMDNSPGGQVWASAKFGPLSGALLHLSYGKCAIFQVLREDAGGVMQGGIVKVPATFASGAMRARVNARDGQLYVCGLRGWQTTAAKDGCLQRLRYSGKPLEIVTGLRVRHDALEITVSTPLNATEVADLGNWDVQWWNYRWTKSYGSDLYSVNDPTKSLGKRGQLKGESAPLKSVRLSPDGKTLTLEIPGLTPVMQVMTRANLQTAAGAPFKVEIAHTISKVP